MGLGLGQNGHDFSNGMVHIHGGTVTLPREVRTIPANREMAGLGAHLRQTATSREVTGRTEELHQLRRRGTSSYQRFLSSGVWKHVASSGSTHRR
jgi:hypothetical protein